MLKSAKVNEADKTITLVLDYDENGTTSASGKSLRLASTQGNKPCEVMNNGKPVMVGVNCYVPK